MQPQEYAQQPPTALVVVPVEVNAFKPGALRQMKILSIIQIVIGAICVILGAVLLIVGQIGFRFMGLEFTGYGIIVGVYFPIVGSIGLVAVHSNTGGKIIAAMVLNIVSAALFDCFLCYCALGGVMVYRCHGDEHHPAACDMLTMIAILLLLCVAEFTVALWSAILCCKAVCRCCKPHDRIQQIFDNQPRQEKFPDNPVNAQSAQIVSTALPQHINPHGSSNYVDPYMDASPENLQEPTWHAMKDTNNLV